MGGTVRIPRRPLQLKWEKFWNATRREETAGKELRRKHCEKDEETGNMSIDAYKM
jgi:hypothetical protein